MRTTVTIEDDLAYRLKQRQEDEPKKSFKDVLNETIRRGLTDEPKKRKKKFKVKAFSLGLREGLSLDNIEELLDQVEGPFRK